MDHSLSGLLPVRIAWLSGDIFFPRCFAYTWVNSAPKKLMRAE
jgi:hypothetical protein